MEANPEANVMIQAKAISNLVPLRHEFRELTYGYCMTVDDSESVCPDFGLVYATRYATRWRDPRPSEHK